MNRFYLSPGLIMLVIFSAVLLVIRAQPYDDRDLREILLPEGCPAPCFLGIKPGVTTEDEALNVLKASEWVRDVTQYCMYSGCPADGYNITWSDQAPSWINHDIPSQLLTSGSNMAVEFFIMTTDELHFFDIYEADLGPLIMVKKVLAIEENSMLTWKEAVEVSAPAYMFRFLSSGYFSLCRQDVGDFLAFPISVITIGNDIKYGADNSGEDAASLRDVVKNRLWNKYCRRF